MTNSTTPKLGDKAELLAAARKYKAKEMVPLLAHNTFRWGRKVNGGVRYFGKIDPALPNFGAAAVAEFHRTIDAPLSRRFRWRRNSTASTFQRRHH